MKKIYQNNCFNDYLWVFIFRPVFISQDFNEHILAEERIVQRFFFFFTNTDPQGLPCPA